jgi:hypothetical protein
MWCTSNPAQSRYVLRMFIAAMLCVLFSALAAVAFRLGHGHLAGAPAYLIAIVAALPIVGALAWTGAYLNEEKDEFQRNLFIQSLLGGIGATLATVTIWGYLEDFAHAPHLRLVWVYPLFWILVVAAFPIVWLRYR